MDGWTLPKMMGESSGYSFVLHLTQSRCVVLLKGALSAVYSCLSLCSLCQIMSLSSLNSFILLGCFFSWIGRFVLADCGATWLTEPVQGRCWGRCIRWPTSNNQLLDWLTMHLWYISVFYTSLEGTICSHRSELWHFCMDSLRGQRSLQ